jgi:uncharacterized protein YecA (UPF0149 family)
MRKNIKLQMQNYKAIYAQVLKNLDEIREDFPILTLDGSEDIKTNLISYDYIAEKIKRIYGESSIREYKEKKRNVERLIEEQDKANKFFKNISLN